MGMIASGWRNCVAHGAGGITTKTIWLDEREGYPAPVVISTDHWTLNAVGLASPGVDAAAEEVADFLKTNEAPLIVSIGGATLEEAAQVAAKIAVLRPAMIEINLSSPSYAAIRSTLPGADRDDAADYVEAVKKSAGDVPVFAKLSPNVTDIGDIAHACVDAGADGITAINTLGPGMAIDLNSRMPILSAHRGGMSGPAVKPIAVRAIADIFAATKGMVPIIGMGGVQSGEDALELILAGASLVGIATAVATQGIDVFGRINDEITHWCTVHGVDSIDSLTGAMHQTIAEKGIVPGIRNAL